MADVAVGVQAYCKLLLHSAKYPHCAVNGVLLAEEGKCKDQKVVRFVDCIPLFHLSLGLAPMLEIALLQASIIYNLFSHVALHFKFLKCNKFLLSFQFLPAFNIDSVVLGRSLLYGRSIVFGCFCVHVH